MSNHSCGNSGRGNNGCCCFLDNLADAINNLFPVCWNNGCGGSGRSGGNNTTREGFGGGNFSNNNVLVNLFGEGGTGSGCGCGCGSNADLTAFTACNNQCYDDYYARQYALYPYNTQSCGCGCGF